MLTISMLPAPAAAAGSLLPPGFTPVSCGHPLDTRPAAFGELLDSGDLAAGGDDEALRARMDRDGYLFLRGYLNRAEVLAARREITARLAEAGALDPAHPVMDAVAPAGGGSPFTPDAAVGNEPMHRVLYTGAMLALYARLFGEPVRHFDFTWLRTIPPGPGSKPHCDNVYMGRGSHRLCTAWVPIGDVPIQMGGLMILENSHRHAGKLRPYLSRDVDAYCTNRADAPLIESGAKLWQDWDGVLSQNPVSLREKLGGRWLTAEFRAGDLLTFSMATVHASLDNQTDRVRISSDTRYQPAGDPVDERWVGDHPIGHGAAGKRGRAC